MLNLRQKVSLLEKWLTYNKIILPSLTSILLSWHISLITRFFPLLSIRSFIKNGQLFLRVLLKEKWFFDTNIEYIYIVCVNHNTRYDKIIEKRTREGEKLHWFLKYALLRILSWSKFKLSFLSVFFFVRNRISLYLINYKFFLFKKFRKSLLLKHGMNVTVSYVKPIF